MIHDAIVVRRIGTVSLIELRGPPCAGERSTGDIADPPRDRLCI